MHIKDLLAVGSVHLTASPKFAEHVTSVFSWPTFSSELSQLTVFVPDATLIPLFVMVIGTLTLPHTVTEQVKLTGVYPASAGRTTSHVGDITAGNITQID